MADQRISFLQGQMEKIQAGANSQPKVASDGESNAGLQDALKKINKLQTQMEKLQSAPPQIQVKKTAADPI